jgi:hypothetical protein
MSKWYAPELKDINLDLEDGELYLNILLGNDWEGNIWVELKVEDIKKALKRKPKKII